MVHFYGTEYRAHTSCISEAQKYQGALYKGDKKANKGEKRRSLGADHLKSMVPQKAYVEDVPDEGENTVAVIDVPPRAPTPPAAPEALPENVNVFDYLVTDDKSRSNGHHIKAADESRMIMESQYSQLSNGDGSRYHDKGFSYGNAPVESSFERYDSWSQFPSQQEHSQHSQVKDKPAYNTKIVTPGPDRERRHDDKSGQKRKRHQIDDLDLSTTKRPSSRDETMTDAPGPRVLHTGLTGGLTRLVTDSSFYDDRIDAGPTPVSPVKRSKRERELRDGNKRQSTHSNNGKVTTVHKYLIEEDSHRSRHRDRESDHHKRKHRHRSPSSSSDDERRSRHSKVKAIDFKPHNSRDRSVQPSASNQLVSYSSRAELFMSFITKGPDSERGCSINKALKRYHRERSTRSEDKEDDDKELWKSLRLRRNDRGEIILFMA